MNNPLPPPDEPLDVLFAQARAHRPETGRAEYGFETRLLARLRTSSQRVSHWSVASWRLVPFFALVVAALAFWAVQVNGAAQDSEQSSYVQNPEAIDLISNFN
jgi:hypothetical protein